MLKTAKVLRVGRVLRLFPDLRVMLNSILGSVMNLFWSMVMRFFIFCIFSLVIIQGVGNYLQTTGDSLDDAERENLISVFGSVEAAMLNLFKSSTGGADWEVFYSVISSCPMSACMFGFHCFHAGRLVDHLDGYLRREGHELATPDANGMALEERQWRGFLGEVFLVRRNLVRWNLVRRNTF